MGYTAMQYWRSIPMDIRLLLSLAGSILTSKILLLGPAKDYPLTLAFLHILILYLMQIFGRSGKHTEGPQSLFSSNTKAKREASILWLAATVLMLCVCVITGYKTLRFAGSLPTAVFLLSMRFDIYSLLISSRSRAGGIVVGVARAIMFIAGFALVLLWDYRLNITSRDMGIAFLITSHLFAYIPAILEWLQDMSHFPQLLRSTRLMVALHHWPVGLLLPLAVVAYYDEASQPFIGILSISNAIILTVNLASTTCLCASLHTAAPLDSANCDNNDSLGQSTSSIGPIQFRLALSGVVSLSSCFLPGSPANLSLWQFVGYMLALFASFDLPSRQATSVHDGTVDHFYSEDEGSLSKQASHLNRNVDITECGASPAPQRKSLSYGIMTFAAILWLLFACVASFESPSLDKDAVNFASGEQPLPADLDIVISAYDRPGMEIADDINILLRSQILRNHTSRVYVYNKGLATPHLEKSLREHLSQYTALFVEELQNKGREGATYLHHIESQWDNLAWHTLFLQEHSHDFALLKQRIADYMVHETGFMPLSYEGKVWKHCGHLQDGTWPGITDSISHISSMMNASSACQDILMTFRGQFLASRARIQSNGPPFYAQLLRDMQDRQSWMHTKKALHSPWVGAQSDSLVDPVFGYTLERLWGMIMHCSNSHIAEWSPSLLGSYVRSRWFGQKVPLGDVQCMDVEGESS